MAVLDNELTARELPNSLEAEQAVLGVMLVAPDTIPAVIETLKAEYFFTENHQKLFGIIVRLFSVGRDIDFVVMINEAVGMGIFQTEAMAKTYIGGIMDNVATTSESSIKTHCEIIENMYQRRCLISAANDILQLASDGGSDASSILDSAEQRIYDIRQGKMSSGMSRIDDVIVPALERLSQLSGPDRDKYMGTKTGFSMLDSKIVGMNDSDLIILAARPSMGKSAFALNIATNVCRGENAKGVCYFSLEMSNEELVLRMLAAESLVNGYSLRNGDITRDQWRNLARGADELTKMPIYLDDTPGITVPQIKAKVRRIKDCGLIVIDHINLMSSANKFNNRVLEMSEITRQLKLMAKELKIPVIALCQLNRGVENRPDKHPQLADLRESGSIEQDADIILFLYREGYYNRELADQSTTECIIAKNRHGSTGMIKLAFVKEYTLFRTIEYREDEGAPE